MIVPVDQFDPYKFRENLKNLPVPKGNRGGSDRIYKDLISAFDIETSKLVIDEREHAFMYIWQMQLGPELTVIGHYWEEWLNLLETLTMLFYDREYLVVYVHNLSYEFQFIAGVYLFRKEDVFAVKSRRVLRCDMFDHIELRCSYIHANMSLAAFCEKMGATQQKQTGFDYNIVRYPWTELTDDEMLYCVMDVAALVEALTIEMEKDGDDLYSIPLTSTGYVRRDAKAAMRCVPKKWIESLLPDYAVWYLLDEAFRGGNTHASRFYAGTTIEHVKSYDRSSSYPDVQCNDKFPISRFICAGEQTIEQLEHMLHKGRCALFRMKVTNVRLRNEFWPVPYIARAKCRNIVKGIYDNGRILSADSMETTVTDVDYRIIMEEYEFDSIELANVYYARCGKLPEPLLEVTREYYRTKTALKGVDGEEYYYMKSKNKLNAIYGMSAQNPVKHNIDFVGGDFIENETESDMDLLIKNNKHAFMSYAWGVWITAWARYRLEEGIRLVGEGFIYCDTDSVKYIDDENAVSWVAYNTERRTASTKNGACAKDKHGKMYYMGVYEPEREYDRFITWGAKKYAYEQDGKLHITISGVSKRDGADDLARDGGLEVLRPGYIFPRAGTDIYYNDDIDTWVFVDGHDLHITRNAVISNGSYKLGITAEYDEILRNAHFMRFIEKSIDNL